MLRQILAVANLAAISASVSLLAIGDWGGGDSSPYYTGGEILQP